MAVIPLHIVDAFAEHPFCGNPAAIVPNAAVLSDDEMMKISEELGLEVGFVLPPEARDADVRLRFFNDQREDSLSGHVLLAAFASMVDRGIFRCTPEGRLVHAETLAGVLEVRLRMSAAGRVRITCEMPNPRFGERVPVDEVGRALDVPSELLRLRGAGPRRVSCGFDQILVPVADHDIMRSNLRGSAAVKALLDDRGAAGLTLFCPETSDRNADFHCRFLHPTDRRCEDVASGTCLAAVAAFAVREGLVPRHDPVHLVTEQGASVGRPTRAELTVRMIADEIHRVELSGAGTVVMRGSFQFHRLADAAHA
ncbi:MAG: PhzF family phenazine biosynthesis isomerase [Candidatus Krumholzibacteriia bacterium]